MIKNNQSHFFEKNGLKNKYFCLKFAKNYNQFFAAAILKHAHYALVEAKSATHVMGGEENAVDGGTRHDGVAEVLLVVAQHKAELVARQRGLNSTKN